MAPLAVDKVCASVKHNFKRPLSAITSYRREDNYFDPALFLLFFWQMVFAELNSPPRDIGDISLAGNLATYFSRSNDTRSDWFV